MEHEHAASLLKPLSTESKIWQTIPAVSRWEHLRAAEYLSLALKNLTTDPYVQSYFHYESSREDEEPYIFRIDGYLLPRTEPFKHGSFKVCIRLKPGYPFQIPEVQLLTYIYHPAVNNDVLKPAFCERCCLRSTSIYIIDELLERLVYIIDDPDSRYIYCNMNSIARQLYNRDRVEYKKKALEMVMKYACPRPNQPIISLKFAVKKMICRKLDYDSIKTNQLPLSSSLKQYLNSPFDGK